MSASRRFLSRPALQKDMALFSRTSDDFQDEIYLLSPATTRFSDGLGGEWTDCNPFENKWAACIANGDVKETFRIAH